MSSHARSRLPLNVLLIALAVVPPLGFLVAMPWLKTQPEELVYLVTGITSVVTVVSCFVLAILQDRGMDEWQRTNARFSSQWGWTAGACLVALLLAVPPFQTVVVSTVAGLTDTPAPDEKLVIMTFTFGFMAVVFAQVLCTAVLSMAWTAWKSRAARDAS